MGILIEMDALSPVNLFGNPNVPEHLRLSLITLTLCVSMGSSSGRASDLTDAAKRQSGDKTARADSGKLLKGAVRSEAALQSSLKVIPDSSYNRLQSGVFSNQQATSKVSQYAGGIRYSPGKPAPKLPIAAAVKPAVPVRLNALPAPKFTLTPKNGIMSWAPGYAAIPVIPKIDPTKVHIGVNGTIILKNQTANVTGKLVHANSNIATHSGVTSYAPGYQVTISTARGSITSMGSKSKTSANNSTNGKRFSPGKIVHASEQPTQS